MDNTSNIVGRWVHAQEQDHGDVRVYVQASNSMPPSRGRRYLNLQTDGSFDEQRPGPDDRAQAAAGFFSFDGQWLTLRYHEAGRAPTTWKVTTSTTPRKLEFVRKA